MLRLSLLTFWSFVQIYVFCDSSAYVTRHFREIDIYNECEWYAFPASVRRSMPIIIVNAQEAVILKGFGNILCTRETFKRVIWIGLFG